MMNKVLAISIAISLLFISCSDEQSTTTLPTSAIQEDSAARITVSEANAMIESSTGVFVDTRSAEQFAEHHVFGAILAPIQEISENANIPALEAIPPDQKMILYCT